MIFKIFFHKILIYTSKYFLRFATANCDRPTGCRWQASSPRLGLVFAFSHFWFRSTYKYTLPNRKLKKDLSFFLWQTASITHQIQASLIFRDLALVLYKLFFVKKLLLWEV